MNTANVDERLLDAMNPLERFSDRAGDDGKYRPSYPPEAIAVTIDTLADWLTSTLGSG